jgi:hypothetical protein
MDTNELFEKLGGRAKVMAETGLSKGRVSQLAKANKLPTPWLLYFKEKHKKIDWGAYQPTADSAD